MSDYQVGPCIDLLGSAISLLRLDAISLRRRGVLDENGKLTSEGDRRFPKSFRKAQDGDAVTGLERRDEVEAIGQMVYQGGIAELFERLGLPDISEQFRRDVETRATHGRLTQRRMR